MPFWGKIVEFYAKIVKNRKIFLIYTFVDALAQMFASWHSITLQNIWALLQSWICQHFAILGQNSQILCTNREKLWIIFSIYICWCIGTNVCNIVLGNLTKHISGATKLNLPKSFFYCLTKQSNSEQMSREIGKHFSTHILLN